LEEARREEVQEGTASEACTASEEDGKKEPGRRGCMLEARRMRYHKEVRRTHRMERTYRTIVYTYWIHNSTAEASCTERTALELVVGRMGRMDSRTLGECCRAFELSRE